MAGDGSDQDTLTEGRPGQNPADAQQYGDPPDELSDLLKLDPKKAAAYAYKLWKDQPKEPRQRRRAEWQVNAARREGRSNVYVQKVQDKGLWQMWEPPWSSPPIPVLNKADRLCRRLEAVAFADPPIPECVPSTGDEEDVEAAKFQERILTDIQSESNLDDLRAARRAFDRASVYGSGFIRYYIDERGGGRQAVRIMAKPGAISADQPFSGPNGEALPGEPIARYVLEDGTLQDTPKGAATRWMPALKKEIVNPPSIRFIPHDSEDLWDSEGVIIGTMPTWGELEDLWPDEMAAISQDDKAAILSFKPEQVKDLRGLDSTSKKDEVPPRDKDKRVAVFTIYYKSCPSYPDGCYFVGLGDKVTLHRQTWVYQPEEGDREELEIPLTQYMQFDAGRPEPFGLGLMSLMGNAHELRASMVGHLLQYLDQFAGRRTFIPTNSIIQPKQLQLMAGATIPINPGGKPEFEPIPPFPGEPMEMFGLISDEMDDHSMMQETGTSGGEVPSVQSGKQVALLTQNAMASLSGIRQNIERAYIRACRIQAQQIRMGYTVPQQISWTGEDGQYRQQFWSGSDLRGTADFKIKRGSLSMMTPEQKMNLAIQFQQMGVYQQNPDLFTDALTNSMGPVAGLEEDPSRARIKRQLALWSQGPPEGWMEQQAAMQAQMQQAAMAQPQMGGDPTALPAPDNGALPGVPVAAGPPAPPPDPTLASIFELVKADEVQDIALIRLTEIKRFMATTKFTRWPPEWRAGVEMEFDHMMLCSGQQTIPQQQMAQQQMAEQQAQQASQQQNDQFQQQLQLEQAKHNGDGKGTPDMDIIRDPTGRMAGLRKAKGGPPPSMTERN